MKHLNIFCFVLLMGSLAWPAQAQTVEAPQRQFWHADGLRIDFRGGTPVFDANNQTITSSYPESISGWSDDQGNLLFTMLRSYPPLNMPIIRKYVNGSFAADVPFWTNTLTYPDPNTYDYADALGGEVNVIPFPHCTGSNPTKFLIIYNRAEALNPQSNRVEYVVYDYPTNTISAPVVLSVTTPYFDQMGMAVSRMGVDASGYYRNMYFIGGNQVYQSRISFSGVNMDVLSVQQTPTSLFTIPGVTRQHVIELELNHDGDKLAWINGEHSIMPQNTYDNTVRVLDLNTLNYQTWTLGGPGFAYLTGLEWTPEGDKVFVNRDVPSLAFLSGLAMWDVTTGWTGFSFLSRRWTHSQIELAHDGWMYVTDGTDLLRINATTGGQAGVMSSGIPQTPYRTFKLGYSYFYGNYDAPTGHVNYRLPDQVDGEVQYYNNGNGNFTLGTLSTGGGPLCDGSDIYTIGADVYQVELQLIQNGNFGNPVQVVTLTGNQTFDLSETLDQMQCGVTYQILYVWKPICGINGPATSHGAVTYSFYLVCEDAPVVTTSCITGKATVTNPPVGIYGINWRNSSGAVIASGVTSLSLPDGNYTVEFVQNCVRSTAFTMSCGGLTPVKGPLGMRPGLDGEINAADLKLYPNPAKDEISLPVTLAEGDQAVQVYDLHGRQVQVQRMGRKISVRGWEPGMYIFQLMHADGTESRERVMVIE
ncbi:MAG TPA: hypothetical protein DCE41_21335 [Cytophagales bacterium]|nr:hypothetical protein [Cytophagales bacterium]HAA19539.1 hypothetical protein [Cytophagales bacterium]HAP59885.1 hypothetical protein [Cytophagales bacterium]